MVTDFSVSMETCQWDVEDASVSCRLLADSNTEKQKNNGERVPQLSVFLSFLFLYLHVLISANSLVGSLLLLSFCMPFSFCNLFWQNYAVSKLLDVW